MRCDLKKKEDREQHLARGGRNPGELLRYPVLPETLPRCSCSVVRAWEHRETQKGTPLPWQSQSEPWPPVSSARRASKPESGAGTAGTSPSLRLVGLIRAVPVGPAGHGHSTQPWGDALVPSGTPSHLMGSLCPIAARKSPSRLLYSFTVLQSRGLWSGML